MAQESVDAGGVDFALLAYREQSSWRVESLGAAPVRDLDALTAELRRHLGDVGSLGLVSVDEDFFLLVRAGGDDVRLLLSDVTAATEWPLARSAVELLELPVPDDEDERLPAGDLAIVADLGIAARDMGALLDDQERYPDELLGDIAAALGFGPLYDDALGVLTP